MPLKLFLRHLTEWLMRKEKINMRKARISQWILAIIVACALIFGEGFFTTIINDFFAEKTPIYVYGPDDMESAFKTALSNSNLENSSQYKIVMTSDTAVNADITIAYGMENNDSYTLLAFSPFVVAYNTDDGCFKSLKKAETVVPNEYNNKLYEIDLLKVINEVNGSGQWANLGVSDQGTIKIFYPAQNTPFWHDFYNFMLLTINGGKYPETEYEMKRTVETMDKFLASGCTEAVTSFDEQIERTDGFAKNTLYIIPEKIVKDLSNDHTKDTRLFFPLNTSNFNYYVIGNSDVGKTIVSNIPQSSYEKLKSAHYRSTTVYELGDVYRSVYDERDVYRSVEIPKENFFTTDFSKD